MPLKKVHYPIGVLLKLARERQLPLQSHFDGFSLKVQSSKGNLTVSPVIHLHE